MLLTLRARLSITRFISEQRGTMQDSEMWNDLKEQLMVPQPFDTGVKEAAPGQLMIEPDMVDAPGTHNFEIDKPSRRKLFDGMSKYSGWAPEDAKWLRSVVTQLDESLKEGAPVEISTSRKKSGSA